MKKYLIVLISIVVDGLIPNITLYNFNNITYFTPICTGISVIFLYDNSKFFYKLMFWTSLIYSVIYINNLLLGIVVFFVITLVIKMFKRLYKDNLFTIIIQILLIVFTWDFIFFVTNSLLITNTFIWNNYLYKISHSIIFNILYGLILFKICNKKVLNRVSR